MRRLWLLAGVLVIGLGCSADGDKAQWDEFWKDLRGDNMQMRSNFSDTMTADGSSAKTKSAR
jgi:hypothetical protein